MTEIYYDNIFITHFTSNRSMTIEEILDQVGFDEQAFKQTHDIDNIDYNEFWSE